MSVKDIVANFNKKTFSRWAGASDQAEYIHRYLTDLNAQTAVIENKYVDKDYLIDYQRFYARSFDDIGKFTKRIHFFSQKFTAKSFEEMIKNNRFKENQKSYLGFMIVKPIKDFEGNPLIGRTLLQTYPFEKGDRRRTYITTKNTGSIFGTNFAIKSVPYQTQDRGVSACATIALWTTLQSLTHHFGIKSYSPAEITEMGTEFPSQFRMFPSGGLTIGQMINCVHSTGLDVEVINTSDNEVITTAVKAYTFAGIPLIAHLTLNAANKKDYHAVVVVGYQSDKNRNLMELYVHDDQLGPYSKVEPDNDFTVWKSAWNLKYLRIDLERFLIPIYHKIRLPFSQIYLHYKYVKNEIAEDNFDLELYLTTVQDYKIFLAGRNIRDKVKILTESLPRFIWIERTFEKGKADPLQDDVFDGTAIGYSKLQSVEYIYE